MCESSEAISGIPADGVYVRTAWEASSHSWAQWSSRPLTCHISSPERPMKLRKGPRAVETREHGPPRQVVRPPLPETRFPLSPLRR